MTDDIAGVLTGIFRETFGDPTIVLRPETTAADIAGWDSLRMVLLVVAVEDHFGIVLDSADVDRLRSVGDLEQLIRARVAAA